MVLARNTYRFALLLVGYGIASGIDDLGAYSAQGPALVGLGLGRIALLCRTLAHYAGEPADGQGGTARERNGPDDPDDGDDDRHGDEATGDGDDAGEEDRTGSPISPRHEPWEWY